VKSWSPAEVLVVTDRRDRSTVAVFVRMGWDLWAKPGNLLGSNLAAIEADRAEYHRIERHVLS
jgi:hypothetical protein